jgi:dihydrofolate reductase
VSKISVGIFISLDGVMQAPGGENGFEHGAWQMPYADGDFMTFMLDGFATTDGLLLGRVTYDIFAASWPHAPAEMPIAAKLNGVRKYVVSSTLTEATWQNSVILKGDPVAEITKLKQQAGTGYLRVIGSGQLAHLLRQHDLVDEYVLWVHPLLLGSGERLFRDGGGKTQLKLVATNTFGSGVIVLTYHREPPA